MIANIDGWLCKIPEDTKFIEFYSGDGQAGGITCLDKEGNKLETEHITKPENPKWYQLLGG